VLYKYPIRELTDNDLLDVILQGLKFGDRRLVTFLKPSGRTEKKFIEANPMRKSKPKLFGIINNCFLTVSKLAIAFDKKSAEREGLASPIPFGGGLRLHHGTFRRPEAVFVFCSPHPDRASSTVCSEQKTRSDSAAGAMIKSCGEGGT
jgi:hypothetical protein